MSKKSFIDSVEVRNPCTEDWDKMTGTDKVRFCSHCAKDVNNLSTMTRKEATRLVRASGGSLCIRYIKNPVTQRPVFAEQLFQITRRAPGLAAGVMTASLSLSTMSYAQGGVLPGIPKIAPAAERVAAIGTEKASSPSASDFAIAGTIYDMAGAVIPNTKVTLVNVAVNRSETLASDGEGAYKFEKLDRGKYLIEAVAEGFKQSSIEVVVTDNNASADLTLSVGEMVFVVDVPLPDTQWVIAGGIGAVEYATDLNRAVADDDVDLVRDLIAKGENVNGKDKNYDDITPLFIAVENANVEMVQLLLDFGAKVNARDKSKQMPIMRLDDDATPELVSTLIRAGAKVNVADIDGDTPLIIAAASAPAEALRVLIDAGAEVNAANKEGQTALMKAADADDLEKVRMLILASANVNAKDKEGETAWDKTSESEIEDLLVSHGAIIDDSFDEDSDPGTDN